MNIAQGMVGPGIFAVSSDRRNGGALGEEGPGHVIDLLIEETKAALGQLGAKKPEDVRSIVVRHDGALEF